MKLIWRIFFPSVDMIQKAWLCIWRVQWQLSTAHLFPGELPPPTSGFRRHCFCAASPDDSLPDPPLVTRPPVVRDGAGQVVLCTLLLALPALGHEGWVCLDTQAPRPLPDCQLVSGLEKLDGVLDGEAPGDLVGERKTGSEKA